MVQKITLDDKAIIEEALQRMQSDEPTIPADNVRKFMAKIGAEIQRTGELRKEVLDGSLQQLHDGVMRTLESSRVYRGMK